MADRLLSELAALIADAVADAVVARLEAKQPPATVPASSGEARDWLTTAQAASYLGVKRKTLEAWRAQGRGPKAHRIGRVVRYSRAELDAWVQKSSSG